MSNMRISFRFTFLLITGIILSGNVFAASTNATSSIVSDLLKRSSIYLSHSEYDSAGIFIDDARKCGMSKDSMFYLFAELYVQKTVFDTALAFNYAIKATKNDSMYSKKFEQRYLIYSLINLKSEADKAMDSLGLYTSKRKFNLYIPRFTVGLNSGYKNNRFFTPELYSDNLQFPMSSILSSGYSGNFNCSIDWDLPWPGDRLLTIGTAYVSNKSSDQKTFKSDSLAHTWSTSLQINDIHSFSLSYNFSRNKNQLNAYSSSNSLQLSWIKPDSSYSNISGVSLIGDLAIAHSKILYQRYTLYGFYEKSLTKKIATVFSVLASSLIKEKQPFMNTVKISKITGVPEDPFFLNSLFDTIKKPTSLTEIKPYKDTITANSIDTSLILQQIPYTIHSISPSIVSTFQLFLNFKVNTSLDWTFTYFSEDQIWKVPQDLSYIALNISDGKLYNVKNPGDIRGGLDTNTIDEVKKKRIDNTLAFSISIDHAVWKIGDFVIGGTVEKTYSTLSDNSPVEIPDWSWEISSSLTFNFPFRK